MRILMATIPSGSHNKQGAPIAQALVERGHDVMWYTGPGFRGEVESIGARYLPLDEGLDFEDSSINEQFPERRKYSGLRQIKWDIKHVVFDAALGYTKDILTIVDRERPDVILGDVGAPSPLFASEISGVPCALYGPIPLLLSSRDTAPFGTGLPPGSGPLARARNRLLNSVIARVVMYDVQAHADHVRAELGLPPLDGWAFDAMIEQCDLFLQCVSPSFEYPRSDLPDHVHFIGPITADPSDDFGEPEWWTELGSGTPVVHVTQGTVDTDARKLLAPTIRGLADAGCLVIATTGGPPVRALGLEPLPDNVRVEPFVPHAHLLPHVDVMVTNGGYGGTLTALAHGVPLVVSGDTEDKPEVCARVAWSGAGIRLKGKAPRPRQIRRAVRKVLEDPSYREAAAAIRDEFARYDAPARAADLLEALVT